jgi:hypothetical protein
MLLSFSGFWYHRLKRIFTTKFSVSAQNKAMRYLSFQGSDASILKENSASVSISMVA